MSWENILKSRGSHYEKFKEVAQNASSLQFRRMCEILPWKYLEDINQLQKIE